jgi:hypothetical protein
MPQLTLELGIKVEDKGLRVWTPVQEMFCISRYRWIITEQKMKTLTEDFWYGFNVLTDQTFSFEVQVFAMDNYIDIRTIEPKLIETVSLKSIAQITQTKVPFVLKILAEGEEAQISLAQICQFRSKTECDDLNFEDGWYRCCLWGERRLEYFVLWDDTILNQL